MTNKEFIKSISLEGEIWKDVVGYEDLYQVSNLGRVVSLGRIISMKDGRTQREFTKRTKSKILKQVVDKGGYLIVSLSETFSEKKQSKNHKVHRLVAKAFIQNPENKPHIDHIDRNRTNNCVSNLRWCTTIENHSNILTQFHRANPVQQFSFNGELLNVFSSAKKASRIIHCNQYKIKQCCNGEIPSYKGYIWKYLSIDDLNTN